MGILAAAIVVIVLILVAALAVALLTATLIFLAAQPLMGLLRPGIINAGDRAKQGEGRQQRDSPTPAQSLAEGTREGIETDRVQCIPPQDGTAPVQAETAVRDPRRRQDSCSAFQQSHHLDEASLSAQAS